MKDGKNRNLIIIILAFIFGITGGIAAYKCGDTVRGLVKAGADVHVILTKAGSKFVTPLTFQTLSGNPVSSF